MGTENDWDPEGYLKFADERTQPSVDLVNRINIKFFPEHIADIGCGPGNSSRILLQRWPGSKLTGIDNSSSMIDKAKNDYPDQRWILSDAFSFDPGTGFDIVFSNAAIQWIPDHHKLIKKFSSLINDNGVLAVQLPLFSDMALGKIIYEISGKPEWKNITRGVSDLFTIENEHFYYDQLSEYFNKIDIWITDYCHVMESHKAILDMIRTTGMKPYLERIKNEKDKIKFEKEVLERIIIAYPGQKNGKVLFPFKRLFFTAYR